MADIFVSYSREDLNRVRMLVEVLHKRGWEVWWDPKILPGDKFRTRLEQELGAASCVVVAWTRHSVTSEWVQSEASRAADRDVLVPVLLEQVEIPIGFDAIQHADLTAWDGSFPHASLNRFLEKVSILCAAAVGPRRSATRPTSAAQSLNKPAFHLGKVVPAEYFENYESEFAQALRLVEQNQSFLLIGRLRSGKTSFCRIIMNKLTEARTAHVVPVYVNLQQIYDLGVSSFLSHTMLAILGAVGRYVFDRKYSRLLIEAREPPTGEEEDPLQEFRRLFRLVTDSTHSEDPSKRKTIDVSSFAPITRDVLELIREKGFEHMLVIYDEANRLPHRLSIDLLVSNEEMLASAGVTSIYVGSPEMQEEFAPLLKTFGRHIKLGPLPDIKYMEELVAQYCMGDKSKASELPIAERARTELWRSSRGIPYVIQMLADRSFDVAINLGADQLEPEHIESAYQRLLDDYPSIWQEV